MGRRPRQIFVTRSGSLASNVKTQFMEMLKSCLPNIEQTNFAGEAHDDGLYNMDEEAWWNRTLPARLSDLEDKHFPLFLSIDRVSARAFESQI